MTIYHFKKVFFRKNLQIISTTTWKYPQPRMFTFRLVLKINGLLEVGESRSSNPVCFDSRI